MDTWFRAQSPWSWLLSEQYWRPLGAAEYKALQARFYAGHTGSRVSEIAAVSFSLTAVYVIYCALTLRLRAPQRLERASSKLRWLFEFCVLIVPPVAVCLWPDALAGSAPSLVAVVAVCVTALVWALGARRASSPVAAAPTPSQPPAKREKSRSPSPTSRRNGAEKIPFLSMLRTTAMVLTCICILAVDFPAFPRRFAKTETYGTSLMDVGVGIFVVTMGVINGKGLGKRISLGATLGKAVRSSVPLLVLGSMRFWTVKASDYQVQTSEYGLHWNFFCTLGFLPFFEALVEYGLNGENLGLAGTLAAALHQVLLRFGGLERWILHAPRTNFISANKEGLGSFPGYLALYMLATKLGCYIFRSREPAEWKAKVLPRLAIVALVLGAAFAALPLQTSRQMANLPYICWSLGLCVLHLMAYIAIDVFVLRLDRSFEMPVLVTAINRNQLAFFLIANMLTGLINLNVQTIVLENPWTAFWIITGYMAFNCLVILLLNERNIRLKL